MHEETEGFPWGSPGQGEWAGQLYSPEAHPQLSQNKAE